MHHRLTEQARADFNAAHIGFGEQRAERPLGRQPAQQETPPFERKAQFLESRQFEFAQQRCRQRRGCLQFGILGQRKASAPFIVALPQCKSLRVHTLPEGMSACRAIRNCSSPSAMDMRGE